MKVLIFLFLLSVASENTQAQRVVTGKVVDIGNRRLTGVSITLKGTDMKTATDSNGNFRVELASADSLLIFSSTGYHTVYISAHEMPFPNTVVLPTNPKEMDLDQVIVVCKNRKTPKEIISEIKIGPIPLYYEGESRFYRATSPVLKSL